MVIKKNLLKRTVSDGYTITSFRRFVMQSGNDITDSELYLGIPQDIDLLQGSYHFEQLVTDEEDAEDVYSILAQKERYLIVAAEAGKRLLDEKIELQKNFEMLREQYTRNLEELEQDKHLLRKELLHRDETNNCQIRDLQMEVDTLSVKVSTAQKHSQNFDRSQKENINTILLKNESLVNDLQQLRNNNADLSFQVNTLTRRIENRASGEINEELFTDGQPDLMELKMMREQVSKLQQQKQHLEESLADVIAEKESLSEDQSNVRNENAKLKQQLKDLSQQNALTHEELQVSRTSNSQLREELEEYMMKASCHGSTTNNSLFNELEMSLSDSDMDLLTKLQGSTPTSARKFHLSKRARNASHGDYGEDEVNKERLGDTENIAAMHVSEQKGDTSIDTNKLREEIFQACLRLEALLQDLLYPESPKIKAESGFEERINYSDKSQFNNGTELLSIIEKLEETFHGRGSCIGILQRLNSNKSDNLSSAVEDNSDAMSNASDTINSQKEVIELLDNQIHELNQKLNDATKEIDRVNKQLNATKSNLKDREDEVILQNQQINCQDRELKNLNGERAILLANDSLNESLRTSLEDRQKAFRSENDALSLLEQTKSDMLKLNDQLIDAVQQKIELSEQLEMWQVDMAALIEKQLNSKMKGEKGKSGNRKSKLFSGRWSWTSSIKNNNNPTSNKTSL